MTPPTPPTEPGQPESQRPADSPQATPPVAPVPALSTRERVRAWREQDPEATAAEIARGLQLSKKTIAYHLRALGLPTRTPRSIRGAGTARSWTYTQQAKAREAGRKGGYAKAQQRRSSAVPAAPFQGTILDAMDAAGMVGPSFDRWRTFQRAVFGLPMDDTDRATLREFAERAPPPGPVREAWMVIGRRGGKSLNAALTATYLACREDYAQYMRLGQKAVIPVIAADQQQAGEVLNFLKGMAAMPAFAPYVARTLKMSVQFHTHVAVQIHAGSFRSTRGYTVVALIADEVAFWRSDLSANPDKDILDAVRAGMLTIPNHLVLGLSTPYARRGVLYETYRRHYGQDSPHVLVWNAASTSMHPSLPADEVQNEWDLDAVNAASEFGPATGGQVQFRRDVDAFLDPDAVRAVVEPGRRELPPVPGIHYYAFVDVSGGSGSSASLAIAHRETDLIVHDLVREWRAPHSPKEFVKTCAETLEPYGVTYVTGDRYAGEWPRERFAEHGIGYELSERDKSELFRDFLPIVNSGQVRLLDSPQLFMQLISLDRRTTQRGRDTIAIGFMRRHSSGANPRQTNAHDDVANAVAGAVVLAAEGPSSQPHDPDDDKPFDPFSPEGLAAERDAQRKSKTHPHFDPTRKMKNAEFGVT